ncbi:MAG: protein-L-isoaspartate(D-aspartate) O-methyltransferase [Gallionella sp.]|nr:protein-L-isoaspartate(D-aspartate) O-methyltransferase [Gallionella sp.]
MGFMKSPDAADSPDDHYISARLEMVGQIREMAYEAGDYSPSPISEEVLAIMARVPRHRFVPQGETYDAYANHPLPIGHGQTISQPYIVALMTDLLALDKRQRVLEVGTGSGYQAAILSELAGEVYSMEIVAPLAAQAASLLHELGYNNVQVKAGDGSAGWPEHAPYDGIIVTAAAGHVPQALLDQLKPGGRMVIPVGGWLEVQQLLLITKDLAGITHLKNIEPVRFVPLISREQAGQI